jgi:hypothetical protein
LGQTIGLQGLQSKNTLHDFHAVPFDGLPLVFHFHFVVIPFHPCLGIANYAQQLGGFQTMIHIASDP